MTELKAVKGKWCPICDKETYNAPDGKRYCPIHGFILGKNSKGGIESRRISLITRRKIKAQTFEEWLNNLIAIENAIEEGEKEAEKDDAA